MAATDQLEKYSRGWLLTRYARGRIQYFWIRQALTMLGCLVLGIVNGPIFGFAALWITILGEGLDYICLSRVPDQIARGEPLERVESLCFYSAAFNALALVGCVVLSWVGPNTQNEPLFGMAFLMAAAMNAGLSLPYHRSAVKVRLVFYGAAAAGFFLHQWFGWNHGHDLMFMEFASALIMAYLVYMYIVHINLNFRISRLNTEKLIEANGELRESQREAHRLSLVVKNTHDSVLLMDAQRRVFWANDAFCEATGFELDEVIGLTSESLMVGSEADKTVLRGIRQSLGEGRSARGEVQGLTKNGKNRWVDVNVLPVLDENGDLEFIASVGRDVTEARRNAQELKAAKLSAEQAAKAKAEFLATMSHEIRTPMNGVTGMAELLSETALSEEQQEYTSTIRDSAFALLTIINDVLDLSKLEAGKMTLSPVSFSLRDCLDNVLRLLRQQAQDKSLSLELEMAQNVPPMIYADDGRIRQILLNLIGNAIKFTETGGIVVRVSAEKSDEDERVELCLKVIDTGIGIEPDRLADIFDSFAQAEGDTARRFGGTGLGLTISRRLAEAMDGSLTATSCPGQGSSFVAVLVVGEGQQVTPCAKVSKAVSEEGLAHLADTHILVAEDNRVNRRLLERFLSGTVGTVSFAHDGRQAVEMHTEECPDLILMDMSMPVLNGLDATREIRASGRAQPRIVALTANAFDTDRNACLEAGMDGFLTKPVRKADLLRSITAQLRPGHGNPFEAGSVSGLTMAESASEGTEIGHRRTSL
ncbi:MAG: ATP-binding protein [Paracoccaceae bacterium]